MSDARRSRAADRARDDDRSRDQHATGTADQLALGLRGSIDRAARFIVDMQDKSGAWADFILGVGLSDAWTTAYIGACLLEAEPCVTAREQRYVRHALERAAEFVQSSRRPDGTWGYNARVPSDSDSTSWAARFLTAMGRPPGVDTYEALRTYARADGGFATYNGGPSSGGASSSWTRSHPDVTPVVAGALAASSSMSEATLNYILARRNDDGLWNSYWYRTPLYSTLHNLIALRQAGRTVTPPAMAVIAATTAARDPFELALALEIATGFAVGRGSGFARDTATTLLAAQSSEGWWASAPMLRVTGDSIDRPWELPGDAGGQLYSDDYFTFTTATVMRALTQLLRERERSEGER